MLALFARKSAAFERRAPCLSRGFFILEGATETMSIESRLARTGAPSRNRRRWRTAFRVGIVLPALLLCGSLFAGQSGPRAAAPGTREITDELGRKVRIPQEAERVVSLAPSLTEIVFALADANHLAGDTDFCDYPPEALRKPHVGGVENPSLEAIAALTPDLVLATKSINRRETVDALERIGLPVYVTDEPHTVDEMIDSVEHVGGVLGVEKSSAALGGELRGRLAELDRRLAGTAPRRALFVVWPDPLISVGRDTFIADAMRRAGALPVIETAAEWPHISLEEIVHLQPEFLIFASAHAGDTQHDIDALRTRPGWKDLAAIQQNHIVVVSDAINRPAPRMIDAIESLARALHPEAFRSRVMPADFAPANEEACACAR